MSFYIVPSRTKGEQHEVDLHPTDFGALKPFEKCISGGYVCKGVAQFFTKADGYVLSDVLGKDWTEYINKFAPADVVKSWGRRLKELNSYLEEREYFKQIEQLFTLMGERGIGCYLSW